MICVAINPFVSPAGGTNPLYQVFPCPVCHHQTQRMKNKSQISNIKGRTWDKIISVLINQLSSNIIRSDI